MKRCKRCLIPDTRPDTAFIDGVCSACLHHDRQKLIEWDVRRCDLVDLFDRQKPNSSGFDCIVASSGGKDSTAQVLDLIEFGARPLLVTATTCMLTSIGRKNIDNLKKYASTIEVSTDAEVRARLNYLGLTLVGDISWPEHVAIFTTPMRIAVALGIPLVFYGENPQAQYGGPVGSAEAVQMTRRWVSEFGGFLGLRPIDVIGQKLDKDRLIGPSHMREYAFPEDRDIRKAKVEAHFLGEYLGPSNSRENARRAIAAGMEVQRPHAGAWWGFENLDNAMTGIHDWFMLRKYGYGRACAQLSVDIRNGFVTRSEAEAALLSMEGIFPRTYMNVPFEAVLEKIGMSYEEFYAIEKKFTSVVM